VLRWDARGSRYWAEELKKTRIPANFNADEKQLDKDSGLVREICALGFELGGSYDEAPFWNEPYDAQYEKMSRVKDKLEAVTGKPMRSFSSKYSAYNEDALKIAEKLGIKNLFGRGTAWARAVVYKPKEYAINIISTSDLPLKDMGGGMLADGSIWSRGGSPDDFERILFSVKEDKITLVAQAQLSGAKLHWWNVYQEFFDADLVDWKSIDEFTAEVLVVPNGDIPVNTDVQYTKPQPRLPLDEEGDFPFN
jgi:peptidoglycan/xylan/chitin deacetylase (PgdA/CDA1 family)